jgi:FMN-dependent NADH-azoreductase
MQQPDFREMSVAQDEPAVWTEPAGKLLLVMSSPCGQDAVSVLVARRLAAGLVCTHPGASLVERDLDHDPPPFVSKAFASGRPGSAGRAARAAAIARAGAYVDELLDAGVIVIASGMTNLSLSAPLKAWFDHVLVPGFTFSYRNGRLDGLLENKKAYLVLGSGGVYSDGPLKDYDFHEPFLRAMLKIMGVEILDVIRIEGVGLGREAAQSAITTAMERVDAIIEENL